MGIDFEALIPHRLDVRGLRARLPALDALNPQIVRWWPPAHSGIPSRPWTVNPDLDRPWSIEPDAEENWARRGGTPLSGSRVVPLQFCRHALRFFGMGDRWRRFVEDVEHRVFIRRVTRAIARVFDADRAIYVPDACFRASRASEMVTGGVMLEAAEQWLAEHCGPPAPSPDEIVFGDDRGSASTYYIDSFHDLSDEV